MFLVEEAAIVQYSRVRPPLTNTSLQRTPPNNGQIFVPKYSAVEPPYN